jgi:hypothetical protein
MLSNVPENERRVPTTMLERAVKIARYTSISTSEKPLVVRQCVNDMLKVKTG